MKNWKRTAVASAIAGLLASGVVAWAAQTNYLGTVFVADSTTPTQQLKVNSDGSVNAKVTGGSPGVVVETATLSLNSTQILALFTTPQQIIAAPASGKAVQILSAICSLTYGTMTYVEANAAEFFYTNASGQSAAASLTSCLTGTSSKVTTVLPTVLSGVAVAGVNGNAVVFAAQTANPTTGDGTLVLTVTYIVVGL